MNLFLQLIAFTFLQSNMIGSIAHEIDSNEEQMHVENATVNWADSSFLSHQNYKFEHFKAFYTDEYFIQTMRLETYEAKISNLKEKKANGAYHDTEESYQANLKKLSDALENAKQSIGKIDRVSHYQTHFWTNIQTQDGITVYYELIVTLNNNYEVTEVIENSSIGKKNGDSKIAYQKDVEITKVIEKP